MLLKREAKCYERLVCASMPAPCTKYGCIGVCVWFPADELGKISHEHSKCFILVKCIFMFARGHDGPALWTLFIIDHWIGNQLVSTTCRVSSVF